MAQMNYRIGTRSKKAGPLAGWDVGHQPMPRGMAQARADYFNEMYPGHEHKVLNWAYDRPGSGQTDPPVRKRYPEDAGGTSLHVPPPGETS